MKHIFLLLAFSITPLLIFSQNITVKSFRQLSSDLDARVTYSKLDQNGDKCAIIKIVTSETDFTWDGDMLGIISAEKKTGEYWLYIPHDAKRLTIKHDKIGVLRDYEYTEPIVEATVYELVIEAPKIVIESKDIINQLLTIIAQPQGARIYLNDIFESTDSLRKTLIPGNYKYRIEAQFYHTDTGKVFVPPEGGQKIEISLKPNHGFANLTSLPKSGANVIIDGKETNLITPCSTGILISGEHTIKLLKKGYRPLNKKVIITDGQTDQVELTIQSNKNYVKGFHKSHLFSVFVGYHTTSFTNTYFKNNLANGNIKRGLGYAANVNLSHFPLLFDLSYFSSAFSVENIKPFTENSSVSHRGGELSACFIPIVLGVNLYPYIGAGYQYSQIYASSLSIDGIASGNTSSPIIKAGFKIRIQKFMIFGEYKNGFDINSSGYDSKQIYSGIGWVF